MSPAVDAANAQAPEAGAGSLPMRKRKDLEGKADENPKRLKRGALSGPRAIRLEQNRKAARESRRRKKVMIEELQRSVIFFSRTNGTLKQQNEELTRLLMQAQAQVGVIESQKKGKEDAAAAETAKAPVKDEREQKESTEQSKAETVATQAVFESQGYSSSAARTAAKSANATNSTTAPASPSPSVSNSPNKSAPEMQPGATMQAMANFQQAAAAAMQAAAQGLQGLNMGMVGTPAPSPNAQQVFNETMAAIAMQQAASAAVSGQQFLNNPFMAPMLAWQNHQAAMASQNQGQGLNGASPSQIQSSQR
eukprot:scaffold3875_cov123-Cylindrotheca_fusiformis.AAC.11